MCRPDCNSDDGRAGTLSGCDRYDWRRWPQTFLEATELVADRAVGVTVDSRVA